MHMPSEAEDLRDGIAIPLSVPEIAGNEWKYVKECLDTGWVSSVGSFVNRFEQNVAEYAGAKRAVAVTNGTAGLHTALRVVGVEPGDEVIVSDLAFIASANAVRYCDAYPVFMDVGANSWHMDGNKLAEFLKVECEIRSGQCFNKGTGRRIRAVLPVHILGLACDIAPIMDLANRYCLRVVEDAAEAMGVRYGGRHAGTFGDVGVFSFNGNKIITAGGGGMLVTDDDRYADYARHLTTQAKDDPIEYFHNEIGYNYRLSNIQSAVGVAQLERITDFIQKKRAIAEAYESAFSNLEGITLMPVGPNVEPTYWLYSVLLPENTTLALRKGIIRKLNSYGVGARPFWHVLHDLPPYRSCQAYKIEHSIRLHERGVSLPSSVGLQGPDLARCISTFERVVSQRI